MQASIALCLGNVWPLEKRQCRQHMLQLHLHSLAFYYFCAAVSLLWCSFCACSSLVSNTSSLGLDLLRSLQPRQDKEAAPFSHSMRIHCFRVC